MHSHLGQRGRRSHYSLRNRFLHLHHAAAHILQGAIDALVNLPELS